MKSPNAGRWHVWREKVRAQWLTVNATTEEGQRRGRLLARFIAIMIALTLIITLSDLLQWIFASSSESREHFLLDVFSLVVVATLFWSNKYGYATFTAHLTLLLAVLGSSLLYAVYYNKFVLIYFAFPIMMASFVLKPFWSIIYAGISALGYSLAHLSPNLPLPYNFEGVLVFFALAIISFLSASRLEEAVRNAEQSGAHPVPHSR